MFDLFLPFIVGAVLGVEPPSEPHVETAATATAVAAASSGDDLDASRPPEPQVPTGKFTTAVEVKPILSMTQANWVAVRDFNGQDLIYFTHLLSWRCGLWDIRYGINGAAPETVVAMEPCNDALSTPNAMTDVANFLPYVAHAPGSVDSVTVEIVYDDGTTESATFQRADIQIP